MRVLQVITRGDDIGGAQAHVRELAHGLQRLGIEVLVAAGGDGPFGDLIRHRGLPYHSLRHMTRAIHPLKDPLALRELILLTRSFRPDLVAAHSSKAGWLARLAGRLTHTPTCFTVHGWAFSEGVPQPWRSVYQTVEHLAAPLADRLITVSDYDRALALRSAVGRPEQLVTIYNGVSDVPTPQVAPRAGPLTILMVARFAVPKDHSTLLRAAALLPGGDWRLQFAGDGPLQRAAEALARELGVAQRVQFLGERSDVPALLAAADLFVLASRWEGLPICIIEAMRAGLPVIASDVGGVRELVAAGETGLLIPPGDPQTLAAALQRLIQNPELRQEMGSRGRQRFACEFTAEVMVKQTLQVYEQVLRAHG